MVEFHLVFSKFVKGTGVTHACTASCRRWRLAKIAFIFHVSLIRFKPKPYLQPTVRNLTQLIIHNRSTLYLSRVCESNVSPATVNLYRVDFRLSADLPDLGLVVAAFLCDTRLVSLYEPPPAGLTASG